MKLSRVLYKSAVNPFGIKLLPEELRSLLFIGCDDVSKKGNIEKAWEGLAAFGLGQKKSNDGDEHPKQSHVVLPKLYGNIETHFFKIAENQVKPYQSLVSEILSTSEYAPRKPDLWSYQPGWTRYDPNDPSITEAVNVPLEDVFSFDVEVCVKDGHHPIMATALSTKAWYSWCSSHLINDSKPEILTKGDLIPITQDPNQHRLVIGHNVCYDRARCSTEYDFVQNQVRFLDTMSLHIVVSGMSSEQRMIKQSKSIEFENGQPNWFGNTSLNNLSDVYQLYCQGQPLRKETRDVFVTGTREDIRQDFQNLMNYCATDVEATQSLIRKLFPIFQQRSPHPASLAGMLEMSKPFLPIQNRWFHYVRQAEDACNELEEETEQVLGRLAREACQLAVNDAYKKDLWLWNQDWSRKGLKFKASSSSKFKKTSESKLKSLSPKMLKYLDLMQTAEKLAKTQPRRPGYPNWFQSLVPMPSTVWHPSIPGLTPSKRLTPSLLQLCWMKYPLHWDAVYKWGYVVPKEDDLAVALGRVDEDETTFPREQLVSHLNPEAELLEEDPNRFDPDFDLQDFNFVPKDHVFSKLKKPKAKSPTESVPFHIDELEGCEFHKLPHKDGNSNNVGNPLAKDFLDKVKDGVLAPRVGGLASRVLMAGKVASYWRSNRERIANQMVVQFGDANLAILPHLVPAGTLTRRAVERTWLTASNAKADRIGSELKTLVEAPEGYHLVRADVDSQELWIAAVLGDAHLCKEHGSTPLGWMTLQGNKSDGTDMHSMTAKSVGVSRDNAKILNYGRIYGAGVSFAKLLLQKFNPSLTSDEARSLANRMYLQTKGEKIFVLNQTGAQCYAVTQTTEQSRDWKQFVGQALHSREMSKVVKVKRKLDHLFQKLPKSDQSDCPMWKIKDSNAEDLLLQLGVDWESTQFTTTTVIGILKSLDRLYSGPARETTWSADVHQLTVKTLWKGGTESHTFNRLEEIALGWEAKTPVLGCRITRALDSRNVGTEYMPSRINWVVQSSAVDYLHLLLTAMKWLMDEFGISGRYVISIHDEVCYLVKSEDRLRAALAMQMANLMVRAMFCSRLGFDNLPEDVAYFSSVDVDRVMRKDPDSECVTPTNPQGLTAGHGIPKGQALTVNDIVSVIGAELRSH